MPAPRAKNSFEFEAIGTQWQIDLIKRTSPSSFHISANKNLVIKKIHARIEEFDKNYSRFREDSLVTEISQKAGVYTLPADAQPMLDLYKKLYSLTGGAVTPLIGNMMVEAGYDAKYSLKPGLLHSPPAWDEAMEYRFPTLKIKKPIMLDFGAIGKGYLIDIVGEILEKEGFSSYVVDAGGDIRCRNESGSSEKSENVVRIGLEHPGNPEQVIGIAFVKNESICCSAGNRRVWANFHHIINPHTRTSPRQILSVWTIAKTTLLADALATCLFFVEPEEIKKTCDFEYLILYPDYSIKRSPLFKAEIFTK